MLATVAYRAGKVLRDAPAEFSSMQVAATVRTPNEILAHMGDLFDWALTMARNATVWHDSVPLEWEDEVSRFFATLTAFDTHLASTAPLAPGVIPMLLQGAVADALTHTGQLAMLRRVFGQPIRGESYARANIAAGRTGMQQAPARFEFD